MFTERWVQLLRDEALMVQVEPGSLGILTYESGALGYAEPAIQFGYRVPWQMVRPLDGSLDH